MHNRYSTTRHVCKFLSSYDYPLETWSFNSNSFRICTCVQNRLEVLCLCRYQRCYDVVGHPWHQLWAFDFGGVTCSFELPWALDICSPWLCWWLHKPASMTTSAIHWMAEMKAVLCMCCKRPRGSEKLSLLKVRGQVPSRAAGTTQQGFCKFSMIFLGAMLGMHRSLFPEATVLSWLAKNFFSMLIRTLWLFVVDVVALRSCKTRSWGRCGCRTCRDWLAGQPGEQQDPTDQRRVEMQKESKEHVWNLCLSSLWAQEFGWL